MNGTALLGKLSIVKSLIAKHLQPNIKYDDYLSLCELVQFFSVPKSERLIAKRATIPIMLFWFGCKHLNAERLLWRFNAVIVLFLIRYAGVD